MNSMLRDRIVEMEKEMRTIEAFIQNNEGKQITKVRLVSNSRKMLMTSYIQRRMGYQRSSLI
jgi:hypothetical protein